MQLRDARGFGLIEEPTPVRHPGQFNAESVYASDTIDRLKIVQSVSPEWESPKRRLDYLAGTEELVLQGFDVFSTDSLRQLGLRWAMAEMNTLIGRRESSLSIPVDARAPDWETSERRGIARRADRILSPVSPELRESIKADMYSMAGVARSRDIPTGRVHQPDSRAAIDHLVHVWQTAPAPALAQAFPDTREILADSQAVGIEGVMYRFFNLPPGVRLDDLVPLLLAQYGHVCKNHHTLHQAMLPHLVIRMPVITEIMQEQANNPPEPVIMDAIFKQNDALLRLAREHPAEIGDMIRQLLTPPEGGVFPSTITSR